MALQVSLINHYDQQMVSDTPLFISWEVSSIMSHHMTNSMWVRLLHFLARVSLVMAHPMPTTESVWHCFTSLPGSLINISLPMTNRMWVTLFCFFARQSHQSCLMSWPTACEQHWFICARQSHKSCLITWPTECEWDCFTSWPGSFIYDVSSNDQQAVSNTALFFTR